MILMLLKIIKLDYWFVLHLKSRLALVFERQTTIFSFNIAAISNYFTGRWPYDFVSWICFKVNNYPENEYEYEYVFLYLAGDDVRATDIGTW